MTSRVMPSTFFSGTLGFTLRLKLSSHCCSESPDFAHRPAAAGGLEADVHLETRRLAHFVQPFGEWLSYSSRVMVGSRLRTKTVTAPPRVPGSETTVVL
jgi:hypothetical protein